jgi:hypothetical protein
VTARGRRPGIASLLAGAAVVVLAVLAVVWPQGGLPRAAGVFLVYDPAAGLRSHQVYPPLARYCTEVLERNLVVVVTGDLEEFLIRARDAELALCPDAVALRAPAQLAPLAAGQRRAPYNLRPVTVLVSRVAASAEARPWLTAPGRTVCGDSLSLACVAPLCDLGRVPDGPKPAFGADPYDHGRVLEALRLGAFDHALVRQWDAEGYREAGLLPAAEFTLRRLDGPWPDVVLLASRRLPGGQRLALGERLAALGREGEAPPAALTARAALAGLHLDGFSLLLETDFEALRGRYPSCWPRVGR